MGCTLGAASHTLRGVIELTGEGVGVTVDLDHGGRLASLDLGGHELPLGRVDDPLGWGCYPMAPFAGRIRGGRFQWKRQVVELARNHGPHAIHGTVLDRAWQAEQVDDGYLRARCDLQPGWPEAGWAIEEVALGPGRVELRLEVHAAEISFPATCGWHPWFRRRLGGAAGGQVEVELPADRWYPRGGDGLPTGAVEDAPEQGPFDDCFTAVRWPVRLTWPGALALELEATCDHVVLYDEPDDAVCVEPQTGPPDAPNLGLATVVQPGAPLVLETSMRWSTDA
jgi:aldose 1-epimerase